MNQNAELAFILGGMSLWRWFVRGRVPKRSLALTQQLMDAHWTLEQVRRDLRSERDSPQIRELQMGIAEVQGKLLDAYEDEVARVMVSRQWAEDWDSGEDGCYDRP